MWKQLVRGQCASRERTWGIDRALIMGMCSAIPNTIQAHGRILEESDIRHG
jgi:hypothetical protein